MSLDSPDLGELGHVLAVGAWLWRWRVLLAFAAGVLAGHWWWPR